MLQSLRGSAIVSKERFETLIEAPTPVFDGISGGPKVYPLQ